MDKLETLWTSTGLYHMSGGQLIMMLVCLGLLWLAVHKKFEPLLLLPIGFGGILANIPAAGWRNPPSVRRCTLATRA